MSILIAEHDWAEYAAYLAERELSIQASAGDNLEALTEMARGCEIWLGQPDLLAALLRTGAKPKWLQSTWAGIAPLMAPDLPRDYVLTRAVGIFGQVMAEYVLCYMLAHERSVLTQQHSQRSGHWPSAMPGRLHGRKVLVVGCGDIGQTVARFLVPFGVVLRGVASQVREQAPFAQVIGLEGLAQQVKWADYVINLLPDTADTQDIYDAAMFACFKPSAVLINVGRGKAVVDADLVAALAAGNLAGAVIDVCRQEPLLPEHPFWQAPNLLLTGHSSAPTDSALMAKLFTDNMHRWQHGQPLQGYVDFARGY